MLKRRKLDKVVGSNSKVELKTTTFDIVYAQIRTLTIIISDIMMSKVFVYAVKLTTIIIRSQDRITGIAAYEKCSTTWVFYFNPLFLVKLHFVNYVVAERITASSEICL